MHRQFVRTVGIVLTFLGSVMARRYYYVRPRSSYPLEGGCRE